MSGIAPWSMSYHAAQSRERRAEDRDLPRWPRKEAVRCCLATRDSEGRLCIGLCGPECERRRSA